MGIKHPEDMRVRCGYTVYKVYQPVDRHEEEQPFTGLCVTY
jgi:hypothetical protein